MSSEWTEIALGEFAEVNPRRSIPKNESVPFVEMAALPTNNRDIDSNAIAAKVFSGGGAKFKNGDTLVARITPCLENGKTAFVDRLPENVCAFGSTEFIVLGPKSPGDKLFLYYLARSEEFRSYAISRMEGTSGRQRVPSSAVSAYRFACPPDEIRTEIGNILGALDDRITLLRETNATLEAIAQALFKSWFVDFDPVRAKLQGQLPEGMDEATAALFPNTFEESEFGLVPKGWQFLPLADAYQLNPTRKLKKGDVAPYLDMASVNTNGHSVSGTIAREFGSGTKFINGDTLLARITPCLENGKTAFVDFLAGEQTGWGSTEFVVLRPKVPLPTYHGYLLSRHSAFREHAIQSMSGTSGRQRIQNDVLGRFPVAVPCTEIGTAFGEISEGIQLKIAASHEHAQTLITLRDTLLPRLISGQLRIADVEGAFEASEVL